MKSKIALAVIAGDDCIEQGIEMMIESVRDQLAGIFISFNGKNGVPERLKDLLIGFGVDGGSSLIAEIPWTGDFSVARNHSFMLVDNHPAEFDWILWLDCDDIVPEDVDFQKIIDDSAERHAHQIFMEYLYQSDQHNAITSHYKDRLHRADIHWTWIYPIHENCTGPLGIRQFIAPAEKYGLIEHHRIDSTEPEKQERNRRIIAAWYRRDPEDLRAVQMMAHETFRAAERDEDTELVKEALNLYELFIDRNAPTDDSYISNMQVGRLYRMLGQSNNAINIFLQGIKLRPSWPGCYTEIAETYATFGHAELAIEWAERVPQEMPHDTFVPLEPLDVTYRPMMIAGAAHMDLRQFKEAEACYKKAYEIRPDKFTEDLWQKSFVAAIETPVLGTVDIDKVRKNCWGRESDKSICFVTRRHFETWDTGKLEREGLGGTETCIIRLAQELAGRGWRVVIFGTPEREGVDDDGIEWYQSRRWHPDEPYTAVVAVRMPELMDAPIKTPIKIIWMHDVNVGDHRMGDFGEDRFDKATAIVAPSYWHANHIVKVYGKTVEEGGQSKVNIITNGFEPEIFYQGNEGGTVHRDPHRMIYASSPDRGLNRLLDLWPEILEMWPDARLEVFYGWDAIDRIIEAGDHTGEVLAYFKQMIVSKLEIHKDSVTWHGRQPQSALADMMWRCGIMPYPADFLETFGLVFQQALVAGCIPVAPDLGALSSMLPRELLVSGAPPNSEAFERMFIGKLREVAGWTEEYRFDLIEEQGVVFERMEWGRVANSWEGLLGKKEAENLIQITEG